MKINFNKLFEHHHDSSHTPSTVSLQNSYQIQEPSIIASPTNNINLHYKFSEPLYFDDSILHQNENNNILHDISLIGRTFQNFIEKHSLQKSAPKKNNKNVIPQKHKNFEVINNKFHTNQYDQLTPGQRLYYQSKANKERKKRQMERLKKQIQQQNNRQITFKPVMNENSKKILQLAQSPIRKMKNLKNNIKNKNQDLKQTQNSIQRKYEEELKECTFHPITNQRNNQGHFSSTNFQGQKNSNPKVFDQLYNEHKKKLMKRKIAQEELSKKQVKMTKQQFQEFLLRNQGYIQQKLQRQQLMKVVSSQYDLTSGRKLFQPKVQQSFFNSAMLLKNNSIKIIDTPSPKIKLNNNASDYESSQNKKLKSSSSKSKNNKNKNKNKKETDQNSKNITNNIFNKHKSVLNDKNDLESPVKAKNLMKYKKSNRKRNSTSSPLGLNMVNALPYQISKLQHLPQENQVMTLIQKFEQCQENNYNSLGQEQSNIDYPKSNHFLFNKLVTSKSIKDEKDYYKNQQSSIPIINFDQSNKDIINGKIQIFGDLDHLNFPKQSKKIGVKEISEINDYHNDDFSQDQSQQQKKNSQQFDYQQEMKSSKKQEQISENNSIHSQKVHQKDKNYQHDLQNIISHQNIYDKQPQIHDSGMQIHYEQVENQDKCNIEDKYNNQDKQDDDNHQPLQKRPRLYINPKMNEKHQNLFEAQIQQEKIISLNQQQLLKVKSKQLSLKQNYAKTILYESIYLDQENDQKKEVIRQTHKPELDLMQKQPIQSQHAQTIVKDQNLKDQNNLTNEFQLEFAALNNQQMQPSVQASPQTKKKSINITSLLKAKKKKSIMTPLPEKQ